MKKFDKADLKILKGNFRAIGKSIPSCRSKTGYVSDYYVRLVLAGKVKRDNPTTRAIQEKAEKLIEILKA